MHYIGDYVHYFTYTNTIIWLFWHTTCLNRTYSFPPLSPANILQTLYKLLSHLFQQTNPNKAKAQNEYAGKREEANGLFESTIKYHKVYNILRKKNLHYSSIPRFKCNLSSSCLIRSTAYSCARVCVCVCAYYSVCNLQVCLLPWRVFIKFT